MSHYKPYPAYKDSGVEWLGRVPEHWESARFDAKTTTHRDSIEAGRLNGMRVLHYSIPAVQEFGCAQEEDGSEIDSNKLVVGQRQLLVSKLNPHKQTLVVADRSDSLLAVASTEFVPLIPVSADLGYITYVWSSAYCQHYLLARCESSTRSHQRVAPSDITRMPWAWPDLEEQAAIVSALDRETARIDALVAKKTRFIELLREKRQALITHAVTKGLDPNVKMKDSGVEWLGEVPEHWEALPLRRVVSSVKTGGTPASEPPSAETEGIAWFTPGDFGNGLVLAASEKRVSVQAVASCEAKVYPAGSILVVSIGATLGKVGFLAEPASANQQINAVIPSSRIDGYFLAYSLSVKTEAMWFLANAATIGIMNQEKTKEIWVAIPPCTEQLAISAYLDRETARIDTLLGKTERSLALLKERRSALITAVVTGQIDLREAV